jgi:polygalacturonase
MSSSLTLCLQVTFEGKTTFAYSEWTGPLLAISGTSITVTGASGSSLDGSGASYWDGEGGSGGKTKPKACPTSPHPFRLSPHI